MNKKVTINHRDIGTDFPPYVIAELSANHNGSLETALKIIEEAKRCGADAIKLQTYSADTITLNSQHEEFMIRGGLWDGQSLYELYQKAQMPWEWHEPLFEHARALGITIFSSPFDKTAVDLLEGLNAPAYKIASFEAVDLPLIKYVASTGKPMIISTGMADKDEIGEAIQAAYDGGCKELVVLHCVSGYPAPAEEYNLLTLADMASSFDVPVGLSDHTLDNTTAISAVTMGACLIEKHFTLDRNGGGPDDSFSLEPIELQQLCQGAKTAWQALGHVNYGRKSSEQGNAKFRRSLYFVKTMSAGDVIDESCIRSVRPGYGISPKFYEEILGKKVKQNITANTAVKWSDFD